MSHVTDHMPKSPVTGHDIIVRRPASSDAIGAALECAFMPRHVIPFDINTVLAKLDAIG